MRILIASDHAGFDLKSELVAFLRTEMRAEVEDLGTHTAEMCDYPQYARQVAESIADGLGDLGILICGTGIGMSVVANKVPGIVAARCCEPYSARMARAHNAANILCLGGRVTGPGLAKEIVSVFLRTEPEQEERLVRRREAVRAMDAVRQRTS